MPPVRIKIYGLFRLTKRTYLRIQGIGAVILLGLAASGASLMALTGKWRPVLRPRDVQSFLILACWASAAILLYEAVETAIILRMFAQAEASVQAAQTNDKNPHP